MLQGARDYDPGNPEIAFYLAAAYRWNNMNEEAVKHLEQVDPEDPLLPLGYRHDLSTAYFIAGRNLELAVQQQGSEDFQPALNMYLKALQWDEENDWALIPLESLPLF